MRALLSRFPGRSKTEAVETAIAGFLARESIETLRGMAGSVAIEDVSAALRAADRRT